MMNIVVASDENYAPHLATLVYSICINNPNVKILFHILDGGIKNITLNKIIDIKNKFKNIQFKRYYISDEMIKARLGSDLKNDRSLTAYARIFIPEILDESIDYALYLDVDAIVLNELKSLFELKGFEDYAIAGVKDINPSKRRRSIGLDEQILYINSGMIVWNMRYCRENNIVEQFIDFLKTNDGDVDAMDQGTINGTLQGHIYLLHPKWNVMTPFYQLNAKELALMGGWEVYYSQKEVDEALASPCFIHFTPNFTTRPWVENCRHPLKDEYQKYRNMTEFKITSLDKDLRTKKMKLLGSLYYFFPYNFFKVIVNRNCKDKK